MGPAMHMATIIECASAAFQAAATRSWHCAERRARRRGGSRDKAVEDAHSHLAPLRSRQGSVDHLQPVGTAEAPDLNNPVARLSHGRIPWRPMIQLTARKGRSRCQVPLSSNVQIVFSAQGTPSFEGRGAVRGDRPPWTDQRSAISIGNSGVARRLA